MRFLSILFVSISLGLGIGTLLRRHGPGPGGVFILFVKVLGTSLSVYGSLTGLLGAILGYYSGSLLVPVAGITGLVLCLDYVRRIRVTTPELQRRFLDREEPPSSEPNQRGDSTKGWTLWLPSVPDPEWSRDVTYGSLPGSERDLQADLWEPPEAIESSGTAVIYLHGSAWYLMDKDFLTRSFFTQLTAQGHLVMDVAYRLCPETDFVGMVGDAKRAVAWLKENASKFDVNPDRVFMVGASAGAHLALLAAYSDDHPGLTPEDLMSVDTSVRGVVSYYGVGDFRSFEEFIRNEIGEDQPTRSTRSREPGPAGKALMKLFLGRTFRADQLPPLPPHEQMMEELIGGQPDEVPERYDLASPVEHVDEDCPPTLLFHGTHDSIVPPEYSRVLQDPLEDAGVPSMLIEYPRTEHAFDILYPPMVGPAAKASLHDLKRFLEVLG